MSEKPDEVEVDDQELELAAGGIILITNPGQQTNNTYTVNSTIYFQTDISQNIT